jgi:DNA-binding Lrp family transcriptional regulator
MLELKEKEKEVLRHFRKNAREALTLISRKTNVPVSTIFDKLKRYEEQFIKKHTTLIDFQKLGYMTRANILLKANMKGREALKKHLLDHKNVSLYKINNGYDYLAEVIFHHIKDLEDFIETLETEHTITNKNVYYIIEDICKEEFMAKAEPF